MIDLTDSSVREMVRELFIMRPVHEYDQDVDGPALFWNLPVVEPPTMCLEPDAEFGEGAFTHWSPLPSANFMTASDGMSVGGD